MGSVPSSNASEAEKEQYAKRYCSIHPNCEMFIMEGKVCISEWFSFAPNKGSFGCFINSTFDEYFHDRE